MKTHLVNAPLTLCAVLIMALTLIAFKLSLSEVVPKARRRAPITRSSALLPCTVRQGATTGDLG